MKKIYFLILIFFFFNIINNVEALFVDFIDMPYSPEYEHCFNKEGYQCIGIYYANGPCKGTEDVDKYCIKKSDSKIVKLYKEKKFMLIKFKNRVFSDIKRNPASSAGIAITILLVIYLIFSIIKKKLNKIKK
ncbi:hypothetical protein KKA15_02430 [Patescibacteria group bacterium]|nr:hypothetical protein [Patescibacteria group bacterium]